MPASSRSVICLIWNAGNSWKRRNPNRIIDDLRQVEALVKEDLAWTYNMM